MDLTIRPFRTQNYPAHINESFGLVHEENDPVVTSALAIESFPRLAVQRLDVAAERILLELSDAAGNLPAGFARQAADELLGVVRNPNGPLHASRRPTA